MREQRTYSVLTCADDGRDHYVLDSDIRFAFRTPNRRGLSALCGHIVIPETDLARRPAVRCGGCRDQLVTFEPPLVGRREPPVRTDGAVVASHRPRAGGWVTTAVLHRGWNAGGMPTSRRRHMINETDEVSEALADAAARWPDLPPAELLRRLVSEGHAALRASARAEREAAEETSGALTGVFQPGDREALREEWPA